MVDLICKNKFLIHVILNNENRFKERRFAEEYRSTSGVQLPRGLPSHAFLPRPLISFRLSPMQCSMLEISVYTHATSTDRSISYHHHSI